MKIVSTVVNVLMEYVRYVWKITTFILMVVTLPVLLPTMEKIKHGLVNLVLTIVWSVPMILSVQHASIHITLP